MGKDVRLDGRTELLSSRLDRALELRRWLYSTAQLTPGAVRRARSSGLWGSQLTDNGSFGGSELFLTALLRSFLNEVFREPHQRKDLTPLGDDVPDDLPCLPIRVDLQIPRDPEDPRHDEDNGERM